MAKLNIWIDDDGDVRVFSDDPALQGTSIDVWKDDNDEEGDSEVNWDGDRYRVYCYDSRTVSSNMSIEDYEEPEEEEEEKGAAFMHRFICPSCHETWEKRNRLPAGAYTDSCPNGDCADCEDYQPYKTEELADA